MFVHPPLNRVIRDQKPKFILLMEKLSAALNGALASKMLIVGYEYDIFSQMKEPITVKDLAQKVECDERYLREWCEALHLSG